MLSFLAPIFATAGLLVLSTLAGIPMIRRLIGIYEAKHELKHGSAGLLRNLAGWSVIAFWLMTVWFAATIIGDWGATGDLEGAIDRSILRLYVLLEIAVSLAGSD